MSVATEETRLYIEQMKLWFKEQVRLAHHIQRTVEHHIFLSQSNEEQLKVHHKRLEFCVQEYNEHVKARGFHEETVDLDELVVLDHPPGMDLGHKWG